MSDKYKIIDPDNAYLLTLIKVDWINIFTRTAYKFLILDSLDYYQKNKGLVLFAYSLMSNNLHIVCRAEGKYN